MVKTAFLYDRFFDYEGRYVLIGGVETYMQRLMALVAEIGIQPIMFQPARLRFERRLGEARVFGVPIAHLAFDNQKQLLYQEALRHSDESDLIVFGADHCSVP